MKKKKKKQSTKCGCGAKLILDVDRVRGRCHKCSAKDHTISGRRAIRMKKRDNVMGR